MYEFVDEQGVGIIHKLKEGGLTFRLFKRDPLDDPEFIIDGLSPRILGTKKIQFLRVTARKGKFASTGKTNYTVRLHIKKAQSSGDSIVGIGKAMLQGYLVAPNDFRDVEYTAIVRVKGIKKDSESLVVKLRGAEHVEEPKEKTLCIGMNFPYTKKLVHNNQLYEREYTHPLYDFFDINQMANHPNAKEDWLLIKVICYNIHDPATEMTKVYMEAYYSLKPFNSDGSINNKPDDLVLYWVKTDSLPIVPSWGGKYETLRADMLEKIDIAYLSCYEIAPPVAVKTMPNNIGDATPVAPAPANTGNAM